MIYTIKELRDRIVPITQKYRIPVVYLFGSYARNEATDQSDVDILIDREGSAIRGMFDMGGLYAELRESVGKEIDLVTLQTLRQKSTQQRTPWLVDNLEKDMVMLYESQRHSETPTYPQIL